MVATSRLRHPALTFAHPKTWSVWRMGADAGEYERVALVYRAMASVAPQAKSQDHTPPANFLEVMRIMGSGRRDV